MKLFKVFNIAALTGLLLFSAAEAKGTAVVDTMKCVRESKLGKEQQSKLQALQEKMLKTVKDKEAEVKAFAAKITPEYIDSLSESEEQSTKQKLQKISQELQGYEQNYYQTMRRAQQKMQETMVAAVKEATQEVAQIKRYDYVINDDFLLYYDDGMDITEEILSKMDINFRAANFASNDTDSETVK